MGWLATIKQMMYSRVIRFTKTFEVVVFLLHRLSWMERYWSALVLALFAGLSLWLVCIQKRLRRWWSTQLLSSLMWSRHCCRGGFVSTSGTLLCFYISSVVEIYRNLDLCDAPCSNKCWLQEEDKLQWNSRQHNFPSKSTWDTCLQILQSGSWKNSPN